MTTAFPPASPANATPSDPTPPAPALNESGEPLVLCEHPEPGIAVVTLNRPKALNALSSALRRELARCMAALGSDGHTRVVVLQANGRAFTAGLDLKEMGQSTHNGQSFLGNAPNVMGSVAGFSGPMIGLVQGAAITGGFELALRCELLLASPEARFADTHGRVGVMPGSGMSQRLSRRIGLARAKELSLTGNFLDADTALRWGLVQRIVPAPALREAGLALAQTVLASLVGEASAPSSAGTPLA